MKAKVKKLLNTKNRTIPILSFPVTGILGVSVKELISSAEMQAKGMKTISENCSVGAVVNMMDLSLEAEAFGAEVRFYDDDIPTVEKGIIDSIFAAESITVPSVGSGRTAAAVEGIRKAKEIITDRPVFAGVIGPFSLACRLYDMTELMMDCFDSPDEVKILLTKTSTFIKDYIKAFKNAGADGVIMAEPAAGLLSPALAKDFSTEFVDDIFNTVTDENFIICYHNCGKSAGNMLDSLGALNADIIHLGNVIDIKKALAELPSNKIIMGNINPVLFRTGTKEDIICEVDRLYHDCREFPNFMISTGCDVPAASNWENINAYFERINELYA